MHISEGVLSAPMILTGIGLTAVGTAVGLKKLEFERIAQAGILSATFFVASLIHIPVGPSSVHLILNGMIGLVLGWCAFPVLLVALILQAIFFQFGGITSLGVNTFNIAAPAVLSYYLFRPLILKDGVLLYTGAFLCGFVSVALASLGIGVALGLSNRSFMEVSQIVVVAHLPVMILEGVITIFCAAFLRKVQPQILGLKSLEYRPIFPESTDLSAPELVQPVEQ